MRTNDNKRFDNAERMDFDFFAPRFRSFCALHGITVMSLQRTAAGCSWDATAILAKDGKLSRYVIELKDRGSYGYNLQEIKQKGSIYLDYGKTRRFVEKAASDGIKGLYVWLFPSDNKMMMCDWDEGWRSSMTRERSVCDNTLKQREKVSKKIYELDLSSKCMLFYEFNENATVRHRCYYRRQVQA